MPTVMTANRRMRLARNILENSILFWNSNHAMDAEGFISPNIHGNLDIWTVQIGHTPKGYKTAIPQEGDACLWTAERTYPS